MTIHHVPGGSRAGLAGSLSGFRSFVSGSWTIVARPEQVDHARSFLGPLAVESLLAVLESEGKGGSEVSREARRSSGAASEVGEAGGSDSQSASIRDDLVEGGRGDPRSGVEVSPGRIRKEAEDSGVSSGARHPPPPRGRMGTLDVDCGDGTTLVVKALKRGGLPARLRGGYHGSSRLLAEMAILEEALRRGVPTARLAFGATGHRERGSEVAILATERLPEAVSLGDLLSGGALAREPMAAPARRRTDARKAPSGREAAGLSGEAIPPERDDPLRALQGGEAMFARRAALRAAGAAVGRAHEMGLDHSDLNLGNVLLRREGGAWSGFVIDLGLSALGPPLEVRRRAANLVRLLRSVEKHLGDDPRRARDAAAFLQGYLSTIPAPRRRRRRDLLAAVRRGLPSMIIHRLGWSLLGRRAERS